MHYVLEQYMNGVGYLNLRKDGHLPRIMAHNIVKNLGDLSEVYGTEVSLAYDDRWAGSADLICRYKDKPTIGDFKQSNKPKRKEWIEDYFYQIGAYSLAHKKQYGDIKQGVILVCTKDLYFQEFLMDKNMLKKYEDLWLRRVDKFHKMANL
jgi:genome maintenance exonuclease 1